MPATLTRRGGTEHYAPPRNDAYVVLLIISLVAMLLGCALLYFDYSAYPDGKAPTVSARPPAAAAPAPQAPVPAPVPGKDAAPKQ